LKHAVALILRSPVPMVLLVGRAGVMVYNDAYAPIAAKRHPAALGARVHDVWPEIADFVERAHTGVLAGRTLTFHNQPLTLDRSGLPEAAWFDLDYSPVVDDDARPAAALVVVQETTAKVLAERREREQQERLRQMFEQAPGFIAMLRGPRHVFELANAAYLQLVGHREILGLTAREALPEIEGQGFFELLDDVYASGKPFIGQAMPALLQRSPGAVPEQRHLDFVFQPVTDTTDKVVGIFVQGTDVTERVAATEAIKAREKLFRSFAETMPNHVWSAGLDGKLDWLNARTYEYSGAAAGALDGDGWAQIVHPEDLPAVAVRWAESVATGSTYETEFRVRRADGVYRWHIVRAVQVKDEAGKPTQWIGTSTDYEDQRQVRDQLAQSERMLRLSQQAAGIASMEIDVATDRMSGTDSLWEKFGLPIQESAPVADFVALVLPEDRRLTSTPASRKAGDAAASAEFRIRRADTNEVRWLSRNLEFVRDATGSPVKIFGALRDITEQKKAEAQQVMLAHELEHRIKNILSVVSAIASQTLRGDDINTARITLAKRFAALGETHALLSKAHWTSVPMQEVVERSIMALPGDRIRVAGPAVSLDPKRALSMALAINELATNSIKYGALANAGGQVEITWQREQTPDEADQIVWQWQETGARDVVAPTRSGFGRFLIEEVLAGDFGGAVTLDFAATGLCCRLVAPWLAS
jgi:PAS domain S-box-containing protein